MRSIEVFDLLNNSIFKLGSMNYNEKGIFFNIELEAGEKWIGVQSGRRGSKTNDHYDVQIVLAKYLDK